MKRSKFAEIVAGCTLSLVLATFAAFVGKQSGLTLDEMRQFGDYIGFGSLLFTVPSCILFGSDHYETKFAAKRSELDDAEVKYQGSHGQTCFGI